MNAPPPTFTDEQVVAAIRAAFSPRWDTSLSREDAAAHAETYRANLAITGYTFSAAWTKAITFKWPKNPGALSRKSSKPSAPITRSDCPVTWESTA